MMRGKLGKEIRLSSAVFQRQLVSDCFIPLKKCLKIISLLGFFKFEGQ